MLGSEVSTYAWGALRYQHTQAIRAQVAAHYSFRTANLHLGALRGVLKEAWRLGLISAADYHQAADVEAVRGHRELAGLGWESLVPARSSSSGASCLR